uniref:Uncharacterized protein n=1 Tax=Leersia perrieri TaxID=77586 RepID=A0A0D9VFY4_9ORYZ
AIKGVPIPSRELPSVRRPPDSLQSGARVAGVEIEQPPPSPSPALRRLRPPLRRSAPNKESLAHLKPSGFRGDVAVAGASQ